MEIVIASLSVFSSVVAAILAFLFTKKAQRENEIRQMKIEAYNNYINSLAIMVQNHKDKVKCEKYAIASNTLFLVASPEIILATVEFNEYIRSQNKEYSVATQDELIMNIYKALRMDLRLYNRPNENLTSIKLFVGGSKK